MIVKKLLPASIAAATLAAGMISTAAIADDGLSASVGVASSYLWRGFDLGSGTPAVSGDISYSISGAYAGVWASSGDTFAGTENDYYVGYGGEAGDFSYDLMLVSYVYPTGAGYIAGFVDTAQNSPDDTDIGQWSDAMLSLGYGPVSLAIWEPIGSKNSSGDYAYYTLSAEFGKFSALVGMHKDAAPAPGAVCPSDTAPTDTCDPVHLDVSYAYDDNLSFTLSQFVADEASGDDLKMIVSYNIPLK